MEQLEVKDVIIGAVSTHAEIEIVATVDGPSGLGADDSNYTILEHTTRDYFDGTTDHLVKLKRHVNTLAGINRIPVELFTYIISFTNSPQECEENHPYILYTWVCHHWRFILVHNPTFWTSIQLEREGIPVTPFVQELLRRTKSAKLDITLFIDSNKFIPMLQNFLTEESHRIQTLRLNSHDPSIVESVFAGQCFPSLRGAIHHIEKIHFGIGGFPPSLIASNHLETLECNSWYQIPMDMVDQVTIILSRLRKLSLAICAVQSLQIILDMLHNAKLHTLSLTMKYIPWPGFTISGQTTLPELRVLSTNTLLIMEGISAPKLSSLDIQFSRSRYGALIPFECPILKDFDFSSLEYIHITYRAYKGQIRYSIVGMKEFIRPGISVESRNLLTEAYFPHVNDVPKDIDILSDAWIPGYLRLGDVSVEDFGRTCKEALPRILPQLTGLLELCLSPSILVETTKFRVEGILAQVPSIEILILPHGHEPEGPKLIDFIRILGNTSLCPRLKHLSYMVTYSRHLEQQELETMANDVGKSLTECVQTRHQVYGDTLKCIVLAGCPPLPNTWLQELQILGARVVTEEDIECTMESMDIWLGSGSSGSESESHESYDEE